MQATYSIARGAPAKQIAAAVRAGVTAASAANELPGKSLALVNDAVGLVERTVADHDADVTDPNDKRDSFVQVIISGRDDAEHTQISVAITFTHPAVEAAAPAAPG